MVVTARAVVFLCLCLSVYQIRGFQIPQKMNKTIQNLLQHYKIPPKERFNGKPVFTREPLTGKIESKMVFMGGVLETYEKLIGQMLKQLPTPSPLEARSRPASAVTPAAGIVGDAGAEDGGDVRVELSYILKKVQDLKKNGYREQEKLLRGLQTLKHIQMDNFVIQSKALWELPWLYEEASTLIDSIRMERRRRRRQAWKAKTHLRV